MLVCTFNVIITDTCCATEPVKVGNREVDVGELVDGELVVRSSSGSFCEENIRQI